MVRLQEPQLTERALCASDGGTLHIVDALLGNMPGTRSGVVLMHGLGEHQGRYAHVVRFFTALGFSVRAYDHRGHGKSGGRRGDVPNGRTLLSDAKTVIDDFSQHISGPPLLLGHSMGGLTAAHFALSGLSPLRGLILSSPALAISLSASQGLLLKILHALAPGFGMPNGLSAKYLSHDAGVVDAYRNDALVHAKISARLLQAMCDGIAFCDAHAKGLAIPTLMLIAGDDRLVDAAGSRRFFEQTSGIAEMHLYGALYHEVFNEIDAERVFDDVRTWLLARQMMPA